MKGNDGGNDDPLTTTANRCVEGMELKGNTTGLPVFIKVLSPVFPSEISLYSSLRHSFVQEATSEA